ncbi:hypothetical protein [Allomuricauda sp. R78024]|uniref:hypothetical protein n=1 Tax=Allomuricauda sp. R78024 TaxID=3093867 RepID=UPI0037C591C7
MSNIQDMNNRIKQNREQRPSKRAKFKENNREGIYSTEKKVKKPTFRIVPEKDLKKIKQKIRQEAKASRKKEKIIFGVCLVITISIVLVMLALLN